MKIEDVLALVRAGFSREEINQMAAQDTITAGSPTDQPAAAAKKEETVSVQETQAAEQPAAAQTAAVHPSGQPAAAQPSGIEALQAQILALTEAIQASNRAYAEQGSDIIDPQTAGMQQLASLGNIKIERSNN